MPESEFVRSTPKNSASPTSEALKQGLSSRDVQGNQASVGIVVPKGIKEEQLNKWQLVYYSFHKRVFSQYLTQLYLNAEQMIRQHPYAQFPFLRTPDSAIIRATYQRDGTLIHIDREKNSDSRLFNEFLFNSIQSFPLVPNPPRFLLNEDGQFEIVYSFSVGY